VTHAGAELSIRTLSKSFGAPQRALSSVNIELKPGEMVALIGASGSGKSTLLRHVSGFIGGDRGSGAVRVGERVMQSDGRVARDIRRLRSEVGFIFQQFNLVGRLSVMTNVLVGLLPRVPLWRSMTMRFTEAQRAEAWRALKSVGIEELAWQRASTLSGGQQQRVAIARALVQQARLILADEPIASLDPRNTKVVMDALLHINKHLGITVVCNLHSLDIARSYCDRLVGMAAGRVVFDDVPAALTDAVARDLYGLEASEVVGEAPPVLMPVGARPGFALAGS
jgi:phosphonate transport system ATP-binding protein